MPRILYKKKRFGAEAQSVIDHANRIAGEYVAQGYDLTLRQLYYQFVARGLIPNKQSEYKRLGTIINDGRMAGLIDWNYLVDRTRNPEHPSTWRDPAHIIQVVANQFAIDKWEDQPNYVEVWVEKEALAGVIERIGAEMQVSTLACRGYMSQSEQWVAAQRFGKKIHSGQAVHVIHLGDHDPSGIDMTRDNLERLTTFIMADAYRMLKSQGVDPGTNYNSIRAAISDTWNVDGRPFQVHRIALNMDQVEEYDPPPNPAKLTDSRANEYIENYGDESWELDALPPDVLSDLIRDNVLDLRDDELWMAAADREDEMTERLQWVHRNWQTVADLANAGREGDD
jgi:hypothetical protein